MCVFWILSSQFRHSLAWSNPSKDFVACRSPCYIPEDRQGYRWYQFLRFGRWLCVACSFPSFAPSWLFGRRWISGFLFYLALCAYPVHRIFFSSPSRLEHSTLLDKRLLITATSSLPGQKSPPSLHPTARTTRTQPPTRPLMKLAPRLPHVHLLVTSNPRPRPRFSLALTLTNLGKGLSFQEATMLVEGDSSPPPSVRDSYPPPKMAS